jgi:site-specific recombinase XerD
LQLSDAQIRVLGKGHRQRLLPLPLETIEVLQNYLRLERPLTNSPALFVSLKGRHRGQPMTMAGLRSLFRHHRLRTTVLRANPHRFRHYASSRTMPPRYVSAAFCTALTMNHGA